MIGGLSGALAHEIAVNGTAAFLALHASGAHHVWQDIGTVNREAPRHLLEGLKEMLEAAGIAGTQISHFLLGIPGRHFMTEAMTALFVELVGSDPGKVPFETAEFGYCGGATTFIQFDRLVRSQRLQRGELAAAYLEESSKWMSGGFIARA
jgi:3-oxoacyl-[acyl-carrier-protein] synthase III